MAAESDALGNCGVGNTIPTSSLELGILIGLQASGKTTFRQQPVDRTHAVVSIPTWFD